METFSGKPVSRETPDCSGPRQLGQPASGSAATTCVVDIESVKHIAAVKMAARKHTSCWQGMVKMPEFSLYIPSKVTTEDVTTFHDVQSFCKQRLVGRAGKHRNQATPVRGATAVCCCSAGAATSAGHEERRMRNFAVVNPRLSVRLSVKRYDRFAAQKPRTTNFIGCHAQ